MVMRRIINDDQGGLPERPMGADCKSVGECLRRFKSFTRHQLRRELPSREDIHGGAGTSDADSWQH